MAKGDAKLKRLKEINQIITANKHKFKTGNVFTAEEFGFMFGYYGVTTKGSYKNVQRSNLKLVSIQGDVNQLMRENGLYLRSRNYYSFFEVCDIEKTKNTVLRYRAEADNTAVYNQDLLNTLQMRHSNNNWGTYNKVTVGRIKAIVDRKPSAAFVSQAKRLTQF